MNHLIQNLLQKRFDIPPEEGTSKVIDLASAIKKSVRPGMMIHFAMTHSRPNAAIYEVARQFWGKNPKFTVVAFGLTANAVILVHGKLVKKLMTTFLGDSYPTPGPNPVFQKAYLDKTVEIENWSIWSLPARLMAGAMGLEYFPTNSIFGSSMEDENKDSLLCIEHPLKNVGVQHVEPIGFVKALHPDISFIHAQAADCNGNVLLTPPYGENVFGAMASKHGVIVTVEKIVSTEFIRKYSHLVKIPGYRVKYVCPVPMGAHPSGLSNQGISELDAYADDYDFMSDVRDASRDLKELDRWIKYWVLNCKNQSDYFKKLGRERRLFLKKKADRNSWIDELAEFEDAIDVSSSANETEVMIVAGARKLQERIRKNGYKTTLAGVGASNLAAWLAYFELKEQGYEHELMAEVGFYGYVPRPADPFIFNFRNMPTCKILTGIETIMGMFMGGSQNRCIGAIGAGQIDQYGNINTTKIPGKLYLVGSGGANDVASNAKETLAIVSAGRERLVKKVPYITSPGERILTLVTDLGIFEKREGEKTFAFTSFYGKNSNKARERAVKNIKENCGWKVKFARKLQAIEPPTLEELLTLRICDPKRQFLGKGNE